MQTTGEALSPTPRWKSNSLLKSFATCSIPAHSRLSPSNPPIDSNNHYWSSQTDKDKLKVGNHGHGNTDSHPVRLFKCSMLS